MRKLSSNQYISLSFSTFPVPSRGLLDNESRGGISGHAPAGKGAHSQPRDGPLAAAGAVPPTARHGAVAARRHAAREPPDIRQV